MKNDYIDEIRLFFIKEYGEPSVKIIDGRKHIVLNSYLDAFDDLIDALDKSVELLDLQDVSKQFNLICEYAKLENPTTLQKITNQLKKMNIQIEKDCENTKTSLNNLFYELSSVADNKKFNPSLIANYFSYYLNINISSNTISKNNHNHAIMLEDSNRALEDNNI